MPISAKSEQAISRGGSHRTMVRYQRNARRSLKQVHQARSLLNAPHRNSSLRSPVASLLVLLCLFCTATGCYTTMHPLGGPGCHNCHFDECRLGAALDRLCTGKCFRGMACHHGCGEVIECGPVQESCSCGAPVCQPDCHACEEPTCPLATCASAGCHWRPGCNVEPGPPPKTFYPQLPPKFLPVPTRPILAAVNPDAPNPANGVMESHWGPDWSSTR